MVHRNPVLETSGSPVDELLLYEYVPVTYKPLPSWVIAIPVAIMSSTSLAVRFGTLSIIVLLMV